MSFSLKETTKYFNYKSNQYLDINIDGCNFEEWDETYLKYPFSKHPEGFFIFLSPNDLDNFDEYKNGDPFGIENNLESSFQKGRINHTITILKSIINSNCKTVKILDIGCGQGHITATIKNFFLDAEVSGIDCSLTAIRKANNLYNDIDFIVGNALNPPYSENYFDIIVCNNIWEHLTDPVSLLEIIRIILKDGGYLVLSTPSRYRIMNLIKAVLGQPVSINKHHVTEYSVGQVIEQLSFNGFSTIKISSSSEKNQGGNIFIHIMIYKFLKQVLNLFLKFSGSHHVLESTVFYLAKKRK